METFTWLLCSPLSAEQKSGFHVIALVKELIYLSFQERISLWQSLVHRSYIQQRALITESEQRLLFHSLSDEDTH